MNGDLLDTRRRELLAVLAHELRSPIGAILGFEELLSEGIYGNVDERAREGLARVRSSALQLLQLVDGLTELESPRDPAAPDAALVELSPLLDEAIESARADALHRNTRLERHGDDVLGTLRTDPARAARALNLALSAAIKTTHGGSIRAEPRRQGRALVLDILGAALAPDRDDPDQAAKLTGAGLRIAMARRALQPLRGTLTLRPHKDGCSLQLRLPALPD